MAESKYVIGLDYGTDSVRAVLVDTDNGKTISTNVHWYARWKEGKFCDPATNRFRQHPLDHIEGMETSIKNVLAESRISPEAVKGICIDTTGSSPLPIDSAGTALALKSEFSQDPNAMMVLWKDHTAIEEADEINRHARSWGGVDYTTFEGGIYSSEWFWAKILHIIREDNSIKNTAWSWMEHCDYMTYLLVGSPDPLTFMRSRCAAGHKAMWHTSWGGLPSDDFLSGLDHYLVNIKKNLYNETYTSDKAAGNLCKEWAEKLGLTEKTVVAVGTFDAHAGAIGAEASDFTLVRVMGTSTCDIMVADYKVIGDNTVKGICGQVDGSVIPGMIGLEAGQSAFGDVLAWFRDLIMEPVGQVLDHSQWLSPTQKKQLSEEFEDQILITLSNLAEKTPLNESAPVALDWINGRRTPDANQSLKSAIVNLNLGTRASHIFRALVEAICFGSRQIVDRFREEGVIIKSVVGIGGVAKKSPFVMQTLADVLNMPIKVAVSEQAPALGAAMYAAVASGIYVDVNEAISKMGNGMEKTYVPNESNHKIYARLYEKYTTLGKFVETKINNRD